MFNTPLSCVFTKMPFLTVIMYPIVLIARFFIKETVFILTKKYKLFSFIGTEGSYKTGNSAQA